MNLARAADRARSVSTPKQAARLYNELEYELALGEPSPADEAAAEAALRELEDRFPGVQDAAREVEEPPRLSRRAGERLRSEPHRSAERVRARRPSRPAPPVRRRASGGGLVRAPRARAARALSVADDATGGWGALLGQFVLWGMGLSIAYLLITRVQAVGKLAQGASVVVRAVVSPTVDPLNPQGAM